MQPPEKIILSITLAVSKGITLSEKTGILITGRIAGRSNVSIRRILFLR